MAEKKKYSKSELLSLHESGVLSPDQLRAFLFASWHNVGRYQLDRRPGAAVEVDPATGLPVSSTGLLPRHRSLRGRALLLSCIFSPRGFVTSILKTDELEENAMLAKDSPDREWRVLALVPVEKWSQESEFAVEENTMRLQRLLDEFSSRGYVDLRPVIDGPDGPYGERLGGDPETGMALGFRVTNAGADAADEFVRDHPWFSRELRLEEWLGHAGAAAVPEWRKASERDHAGKA